VKRLLPAAGFLLCCIASLACAQAPSTPARIGIVEFGAPADSVFTRAYLAGLRQLGYAEPGTLRIERRYAQGDAGRFPGLLQELAAQRVDLVFTVGNDIALVARQATPSLVVVTAGSDDPQMSGLIGDYRRPGGNITGVTYLSPQLAAKRLELLKDAVPGMVKVAVLWDPTHADTYYKDMVPAARQLGVSLQLFQVHSPGEIGDALAAAQSAGAQALFMLNLQSRRIAELSLRARLPVMAAYANFAEAGCLMSYGAVAADMLQRAAVQTDKILKGAKAGDLPFEQAATFELIVNLKTAQAIGLKLPQSILVRADRVVE
jgi:putative ABC transport system substrate-binding protein